MIQLGVGFSVCNALITELGELWKGGSTFRSGEKTAAATCFLILVVGFGSRAVLLRYLFFKNLKPFVQ